MKKYGWMLLLALGIFGCEEATQNATPTTTDIVGHWIEDSTLSTDAILVLVPFNEDSDIPLHLKYGGIEFFDDDTVQQYYWTKCGNDPHPPITPGTYVILTTIEGEDLLQIELPDQLLKYIILEADTELLRLERL